MLKKLVFVSIAVFFLCMISFGEADELCHKDIIEKTGVLYSVKRLENIIEKGKLNEWGLPDEAIDSVKHENENLSFCLLEIKALDSDDVDYYIECNYHSTKDFYADHCGYLTLEEAGYAFYALDTFKDYIENYEQYNDMQLYYVVNSDIIFIGERGAINFAPCLKILIGDEHMDIYDVSEVDVIISYFENVEEIIEANS
jgi:hypothetical protein